ncbi:TlpA family protein disulfide reductase [Candidatus Poribacteria bacterium]|nr:TlpA family protein disulfide reductase [Candidatus Poribacteria bacterium]
MRKLALFLLPALVLALLTVVGTVFAQAEKAAGQEVKQEAPKVYEVGDTAPDFSLPNAITGSTMALNKDILGKDAKLIALTFMNTTCSACQAEVSLLSDMAKKYGDKFKVCLIAVDMRGEKLVKAYNENYHYKVDYLLDPEFTLPPTFGFKYTPGLVLMDNKGKILYKKGGYVIADADVLIKEVKNRL